MVQQDGGSKGPMMDFFQRQWSSYRAIVEHDLMEHRSVADATAQAIEGWLAARAPEAPAPVMVDLGCGDLALLGPLLRSLPLASYTGLDLAGVVLPLAQQALGPVAYPTHWVEGDLLAWAAGADGNEAPVDILHSAFAIHHLDHAQKAAFLAAARQRISPNGIFVWTDVFREPGESRDAYIERYMRRIRTGWQVLTAEQQEHVINHLSSFDIPADRAEIQATAEAAGWQWCWAWDGAHSAEATAVLKPA
jgi:predicted TPR repeat methyltransferase